jgi:hypothetical protein
MTAAAEKPRLIVLTDIGGDPDDQQSMIRLLVHANEFEIEGLIASAAGVPGELSFDAVKPELIREIVQAYGHVRPNLCKHHPDFPDPKALLDLVKGGNPKRGVDNLGKKKDTDGSKLIVAAVDRPDPRPVNVVIWGGSTELAQALWRVRNDRKPAEVKEFVKKLRVYSIGYQDDTGPWIAEEFPDLFYIVSKAPRGKDKREGAYRGMYLGGDESLTSRKWVDEHIRKNHGSLGALYPTKTWTAPNPHATLKEGDTPSWLYFFPVGLGDPEHPEWGGWGGRFKKADGGRYEDAEDTVNDQTHARATVWRWRPAFQNEFAARMDWCLWGLKDVNHPPNVELEMATTAAPKPGDRIDLSASRSNDPNRNALKFRWFVYPEAGTYTGDVRLKGASTSNVSVFVPDDAKEKSIHVVLELTDDGKPPLTRYRRIVLDVK